ncbi:hypothetical protein LXA43DRAFT_994955 [Ganoderma leucocontextum]|nr:hypothetical protein LXA43DRAFT_994955 [Ganoderma leucocontextum]
MSVSSVFAAQCLSEAYTRPGGLVPDMPSPTLPSPLSREEIIFFFRGLPSGPHLIARTGAPWKKPRTGPYTTPYDRELRVVGEHAIAVPGVWENQVGPALLKVLDEENVKWNTIDLHRIHYVDFNDEAPFPVVVCIGVKPGTLSGEDGAPVAKRCQEVLDSFSLNDVEVAIKASERFQSVAPAPAFEEPRRTVFESDPVVKLRIPFTPTVGFPLSTDARPDAEGSSGFFFINGEDTSKVYLLTARHVVLETTARDKNTVYDHKSTSKRRQNVTVFGQKGINEHMKSIRVAIGMQYITIDIEQGRVNRAQGEVNKTQEQDAKVVRVWTSELERAQRSLEKAQNAVKDLEKLYEDVAKLYLSNLGRTLGFVSHSPPIGFCLGEHMYTEDVAIIEVDSSKIKPDTFRPNVLDLGFEFELPTLTMMLRPRWDTEAPPPFKYPRDRLLRLHSIIPDSELRDPQEKDSNGDRCIVVLKRGRTTGLTVGRINNVPSYTRTYWEDGTADVSMEWPIFGYGYDSKKPRDAFSEPGDSGSAVVDSKGRIAGIITGGAGFRPASDITYMTAVEFIYNQMLTRGIEMNVNFTLP